MPAVDWKSLSTRLRSRHVIGVVRRSDPASIDGDRTANIVEKASAKSDTARLTLADVVGSTRAIREPWSP